MKKSTAPKATLILKGSLGDFLDLSVKETFVELKFELHPAIKDLIEAKGVPHTAIFKLTVNGQQQSLDYNVKAGDLITALPFESVEALEFDSIYTQPTTFIVDVHLAKLAKTLRLLGFNTAFDKNWDDKDIIRISNQEHRMILTRDIELLKNGDTQFGYWVRSQDPDQQIRELLQRFLLSDQLAPFTRCMKCNGLLAEVPISKVKEKVPPKVKQWCSQFFQCQDCKQVYWKGSHYEKLQQKVDELTRIV